MAAGGWRRLRERSQIQQQQRRERSQQQQHRERSRSSRKHEVLEKNLHLYLRPCNPTRSRQRLSRRDGARVQAQVSKRFVAGLPWLVHFAEKSISF